MLDELGLSPDERIDLIEALIWNSLSDIPDSGDLSDEQRSELDRRTDRFEREGSSGIPIDEAFTQISSPQCADRHRD